MYVLNTPEDQKAMLAAIGVSSVEELFAKIPPEVRLKRPLNVPAGMSEMELQSHIHRLLAKNEAASEARCWSRRAFTLNTGRCSTPTRPIFTARCGHFRRPTATSTPMT